MNAARWNYLKALTLPAPVYAHESCRAFMVPDPRSALLGVDLPWLPKVVLTGGTYNVGRNLAKRTDRCADIRARADARRSR